MSTTATKIQKLSDKVYQILSEKGFSKLLLDISGAALQIFFGIILLSLYAL